MKPLLAVGAVFACACFGISARAPSSVDDAFARFWSARNRDDAEKAAQEVVRAGASVDEALARLRRGRPYARDVKRGDVHLVRRSILGEFGYDLLVPEAYDPSRAYQARVQLHGGVMMREQGSDGRRAGGPATPGRGRGPLLGAEQIYVMPSAWRDAPWWSRAQIENLEAILDSVKRTYNVDENRVVLSGVSDGATGAYYVAMRDTTPFASFLPLNGFVMVLANDQLEVEGDLFPTNLLNKPLFVVNGGRDPLYPVRTVQPYVEHLKWSGVAIDYHPQPDAGHNTAWWPELKDTFERFVASHPREPHPAKVTWEATDHQTPARAHWVVIEKIATDSGPKLQPDLNVFSGDGFNHGRELFARTRPSGRVDAERAGNTIRLRSHGVAEATLLLSPDVFDLSKPVVIEANGRRLLEQNVEPSLATLMKWAARDNDRTMLYTGELRVRLR